MSQEVAPSFQKLSLIAEEIDHYGRHSRYDEVLFNNDKTMCSAFFTALGAIMDANDAISQYISIEDKSTLALYGLLQAIYIQQDSCLFLNKLFNIKDSMSKTFAEIRKIRNELVGHPMADHYKSHNFLAYNKWDKWNFSYASYTPDAIFIEIEVNLIALLREHYYYVETILNRILRHVQTLCDSVPDDPESGIYIPPMTLDEELREKMKATEEAVKKSRKIRKQTKVIRGKDGIPIITTATYYRK